ncbi:efflux RND transporter permease subunit [Dongshaea marina]|uniref:efflux RND transporter permease subunit n=1 Tax=Dongshaea marina TaxID=2047966 RepID=UPI000D3EA882|nr:efflux RND transporter permease subunit [Dongshaea marina]
MVKLPDICIRHPVFATVLSILLIVVGLVSLKQLDIRYFPQFEQKTATISASVPGASALYMSDQVTSKIEDAISDVDGIKQLSSKSSDGSSSISVTLRDNVNYYQVVDKLRNKVAGVSDLPAMPQAPTVSDNSGEDWSSPPTLNIAFTSSSMNLSTLYNYLWDHVIPRLKNIQGVGGVPGPYGGSGTNLWIWLNPIKMAALKVSPADVQSTLANNNVSMSAGSILSTEKNYVLVSDTEIHSAKDFANLVIRYQDGQPIKISDVAKVAWGPSELTPSKLTYDGHPALVLEIRPFTGANPVDVAARVQKELKKIAPALPKGVSVAVTYNQATFISNSLHECLKAVIEAIILVGVIVLAFLGSMRLALIPIITIPICIIGTFGVMALFGFSINVISLLAIVLAIGLVVDDAIVVVENCHRHIERGESPVQAARRGSRELIFAIIAMTLTLVAVYVPIGFSSGFTATLFREFAFTLAGAVLISGFVALTLSPMMCAKLLRPVEKSSRLSLKLESMLERLTQGYQRLLRKNLEHKRWMLSILLLCVVGAGVLYHFMDQEVIPKEDIGYIDTSITLPPASNQSYVDSNMAQLDKILNQEPTFEHVVSFYLTSPTHFITLKPWSERDQTARQIVDRLNTQVNRKIPGMSVTFNLPDPVNYGAGSTGFELQLMTLNKDQDPQDLKNLSSKVVAALKKYPGLSNVETSIKADQPQLRFSIDRALASKLGIGLDQISSALNTMMGGGSDPTKIQLPDGRTFSVRAQLSQKYLGNFDVMNSIYVKASSGEMIPLSQLVTLKKSTGTPDITTFNHKRSATITADVTPGYSLSSIEQYVNQVVPPMLTSDQSMAFTGGIQQLEDSQGSSLFLFGLALIFIYLILSAQFESFLDPLVILLTVPLSITGALLALKLTGSTLNIYTNIGLVTLIGLITKHGILIVQFANNLIQQGYSIMEAVLEASKTRMRPILMTSLAMIFGALPLALASGPGSIGRYQIGLVLVGGLLIGTLFSLFVIPVAYSILATYRSQDVLWTLRGKNKLSDN